jgi:hypothetical protein
VVEWKVIKFALWATVVGLGARMICSKLAGFLMTSGLPQLRVEDSEKVKDKSKGSEHGKLRDKNISAHENDGNL